VADFSIEKQIRKRGLSLIAGVDEAGRGALFGPVVAAAVILPPEEKSCLIDWIGEIDDSKSLPPPKRKNLARLLLRHALSVGIGYMTNVEIDRENIFNASLEAMRRAVLNLSLQPDFILVDGFYLKNVPYPQIRVIKGDEKSISIASASILAKVLRDEMVLRVEEIYQGYGLAKNKGYGTREHYCALKEMGPSSFHRFSFKLIE